MTKKSEKIRKVNSKGEGIWGLPLLSKIKYRLILEGIAVGILAGVVVSAFRYVLSMTDGVRNSLIEAAKENHLMLVLAVLILAVLGAAVSMIVKNEPMCTGSGIPQVKGELAGKMKTDWASVLLSKFFGGVFAIGAGLSLGREGPSIQLGAMVGKGFSRITGRLKSEERLLMTCGAGAGLAAAFSAPLAGVIFVMEELEKKMSVKVMITTMASAVISDWIASYAFGLRPVFNLVVLSTVPLNKYWTFIILGVLLGAEGVLYNRCLALSQNLFGKFRRGWMKAVVAGLAIILFAAVYPEVLGSGHDLVGMVGAGGHTIKVLLVLLAVKFVFSIFSFGTGAPGGIFLPLLVLGAISGGLFCEVFVPTGEEVNLYAAYFVVLGMAGLFSSIVRAPLTGIILISEMTGLIRNLLPISIVALTSYCVAELLGGVPVYDQLLNRMLEKNTAKASAEDKTSAVGGAEQQHAAAD